VANISALTKEMLALRDGRESLMLHLSLARTTVGKRKGRDSMMKPLKRRQLRTVQQQCFGTVFFNAMDSIISDLDTRFHTTAGIVEQISEDKVPSVCQPLIKKYSRDLTSECENEVRHLKTVYAATFPPNLSPLGLLNAINKMQLHTIFGEACIALRIFCTLPVTVAGGERAFSKVKLFEVHCVSGQALQSCHVVH
ncbi:zinc finger MYM-type protein 1-like, partial [Scomber scombrus]